MENAACHFVFYTGPRKGEAQAFNTARISIGRGSNCDLRLEAFQLDQVAAQHAEVLLQEGNVYVLYDLGTKSGTYVNGERVHERCTLMHEDYLRFGEDGPEVIFRVGEPMPGKQPLPQIFPVSAELEFFSGSDAGRIFPIDVGVISNIGRRADLEIPLDPRGDMIVSGNHCNISYINGHFVLTDSSRNGTYVNGELVDQPMEIIDGDVIMMGDGGPRARFHVDQAKRHYPNHRVLSPVVKKERAAERSGLDSAFKPGARGVAGGAAAGAAGAAGSISPMASAAPYTSGGTPLPGQAPVGKQEAAETSPGAPDDEAAPEVTAARLQGSTVAASAGHGSEFDAESVAADRDIDSSAAQVAQEAGGAETVDTPRPSRRAGRRFALPAAVPMLHGLKFKPGKKVIFAAIAVVILIGLIALLLPRDDFSSLAIGRSNYEQQLETLVPMSNEPGGFSVQVPEGWTSLNRENYISTESRDKEIAIDYVRDPALDENKVRAMLSRDGAEVAAQAKERNVDGVRVKTLSASAGNVRRVATLHQAGTGAPALALLETTKDTMDKLDKKVVDKLLVQNLAIAGPGPAGKPAAGTPASAPATPVIAAASPALPTPSAATPTPVQPAPAATETPAAAPAVATPETQPAAVAEAGTTAAAVESKSLKLSVVPPPGWTGISEEDDAMLTLSDGKGLEIRIARDPGELDAKLTFDAMIKEDWQEDGRKTDKPEYKAGEFHKENQNLMLILIPEKAGTTIVIYATSDQDFTVEQRYEIIDVIQQLVAVQ